MDLPQHLIIFSLFSTCLYFHVPPTSSFRSPPTTSYQLPPFSSKLLSLIFHHVQTTRAASAGRTRAFCPRDCLRKSFTSEDGFSCCSGHSSMHLKGIPQRPKILRAIFDKLLSITSNPKGKLCDHDGGVAEMGSISNKVAEQDRFSTASSTTVFNSCSGSDTEDSPASFHPPFPAAQVLKQKKQREEEVQRRTKKQRPRCGPVSVLGGSSAGQSQAKTRKQQNSSTRKSGFSNRVVDESVTSACLFELLVQSSGEKPRYGEVTELQDLVWCNSSLQCFKPKRSWVEKKELLFDSVREVVEAAHERNERRKQSIAEFLGAEELKQLACQKIRAWERQPGKESSINHLLRLDFTSSTQEWNDLKRESRKIGLEIGEAILEEMIIETVLLT